MTFKEFIEDQLKKVNAILAAQEAERLKRGPIINIISANRPQEPRADADQGEIVGFYSANYCTALRDKLHAKEARVRELEALMPPCGPCDIGENTPCICKEPLVPKKWLDEVIAEREALDAKLTAAELTLSLWQDSATHQGGNRD